MNFIFIPPTISGYLHYSTALIGVHYTLGSGLDHPETRQSLASSLIVTSHGVSLALLICSRIVHDVV